MKWSVELAPKAERQLARIAPGLRLRILEDLAELSDDPYPGPPKGKKLKGFSGPTYRLRSGEYRSIYRVEGNTIVVGAVIHRRDLERELRASR